MLSRDNSKKAHELFDNNSQCYETVPPNKGAGILTDYQIVNVYTLLAIISNHELKLLRKSFISCQHLDVTLSMTIINIVQLATHRL